MTIPRSTGAYSMEKQEMMLRPLCHMYTHILRYYGEISNEQCDESLLGDDDANKYDASV